MITDTAIETLGPQQLRQVLRGLRAEVQPKDELIARRDRDAIFKQALIDKLTHENAVLKRLKFAAKSEACCRRLRFNQYRQSMFARLTSPIQ